MNTTATKERPARTEQIAAGTALESTLAETDKRRTLVKSAALVLGVRPEQVFGMLRNVWKVSKGHPELTDQEMVSGVSMIARYELDPIAREIYVTRAKDGRLLTVVGIDGWIKILDRTDHYDGFEQEIHQDSGGNTLWIETRIYSKTRSKPAVYRAFMKEYRELGGFVAGKIPTHMLGIFSLRHAARRFVPLGGYVVTEEEAAFMSSGGLESAAAEGPRPATNQLDALADALMAPVTVHPSEPEAPPRPFTPTDLDLLFQQYQTDVANKPEDATAIYDRWFGPDSTIEWTPEHNQAAVQIRDKAATKRGPKSKAAKGELFNNPPQSAQEAGQ